jgi:hypothetical protein
MTRYDLCAIKRLNRSSATRDRYRKGQHHHKKIQSPRSELPYESLRPLQFILHKRPFWQHIRTRFSQQVSKITFTSSANTTLHTRGTLYPVPAPALERSHANCQFGGAVAGFVTGFGCRVLLTGARALERWFAVRQVFGVLLSRQTSGFDRAPGEVLITTTVLSALATCQLEAVLSMAARFSEAMVVGHRCVVSTRVEQKSIDPSKKRPR